MRSAFYMILFVLFAFRLVSSQLCSAYCTFTYTTNTFNYLPLCSGTASNQCNSCDNRFFNLTGTTCTPHNLNG